MLLGRSRLSLGCRAEQKGHDSLDRKGIRADLWRPEPSMLAAATWEELILCDWSEADSWGSGHHPNQLGSDGKRGTLEHAVSGKKYSSVYLLQNDNRAAPAPVRITNMPAKVWWFSSSAAGGKTRADKMRCTFLWCWKNIWPKHSYLMSTSRQALGPSSLTPYVVILAEFNQPSPSVLAQPGQTSSICCLQVSGCRLLWEQQNRKVIPEVTALNAPSCTWEMERCRFSGHRTKVWWWRKFWLMLGMSWIIQTETGMSTRRLAGERSGSPEHATIKRCYRAKHKWGQLW